MTTHGAGATHAGRKRENNEDAFLIDDELGLYIVADGLGGHAAGETASRLAVRAAQLSVRAGEAAGKLAGQPGQADLRQIALGAVREACEAVHGSARTNPALAGMACTVTLLLIAGRTAVMAHAGDTRLYLYRDGSVWQLSTDHTLAGDMVRRGELTPDQARGHRSSSVLTRAVGAQPSVEIETLVLDVFTDDVFLLCSDGLSTYLERPADLTSRLGVDDLTAAPRKFVELANRRGGRDNITAVTVACRANHDPGLADDLAVWLEAAARLPGLRRERFANLLRMFRVAEIQDLAPRTGLSADDRPIPLGLLVVLVGEVDLIAPEGSILTLRACDHFGLEFLLRPDRPQPRIVARTASRALLLRTEHFRRLLMQRPQMGVRLLIELAAAAPSQAE